MTSYKTNVGTLIEEYDECAENPRSRDYDEGIFSRFYTFLRRTNSPDSHKYGSMRDFLEAHIHGKSLKEIDELYSSGQNNAANELLVKLMKNRGYVLLPVWRYEHSGVCYKASVKNPFTCQWDSCMAGVIFCSKKDILKNMCETRLTPTVVKNVQKMMQAEVQTYSYWADGEVYVYSVEEQEDEPWIGGFYGPIEENGILDELGITEYEEA